MMRTPVIIPARQEEVVIGRTLETLDASTTYPYVVVNGKPDKTADIARSFGAEVIDSDEGKMLAIQKALAHIASQDVSLVLSPVHILDADSYPIFPKSWSPILNEAIDGRSVISGLFISNDTAVLDQIALSSLRLANLVQKLLHQQPIVVGSNFMVRIGTNDMLEQILEMPNVWPGEDLAIAELLAGDKLPGVTFHPGAAIKTSSRFIPSVLKLVKKGRKEALEEVYAERDARKPANAVTYQEYKEAEYY